MPKYSLKMVINLKSKIYSFFLFLIICFVGFSQESELSRQDLNIHYLDKSKSLNDSISLIFRSGFNDKINVLMNDSIIYSGYVLTNESTGSTGKRLSICVKEKAKLQVVFLKDNEIVSVDLLNDYSQIKIDRTKIGYHLTYDSSIDMYE